MNELELVRMLQRIEKRFDKHLIDMNRERFAKKLLHYFSG